MFKLLTSSDGLNFEEAACWRAPSQADASFTESVMFKEPADAKALAIVMQSPQEWGYFGISDVALIVEPYAFMLVVGAATPLGELCLVSRGTGVRPEPCLEAIAAGDGREVFSLSEDGHIRNAAVGGCLAVADGDALRGGSVNFEDCNAASEAGDGRSAWQRSPSGQLTMPHMGNNCLDLSGPAAQVRDCLEAEESGSGADKFSFIAVPAFDKSASAHARDTAALMKAAVARQAALLARLQRAVAALGACKLVAPIVAPGAQTPPSLAIRNPSAVGSVEEGLEVPLQAVAQIYGALGADMAGARMVVSETGRALASLRDASARAA